MIAEDQKQDEINLLEDSKEENETSNYRLSVVEREANNKEEAYEKINSSENTNDSDIDYYVKFKDIILAEYIKKGPLSDIEALIHIININNHLRLRADLSKEKYLFTDINSNNITITRFLDVIIDFVIIK